MLHGPVDPSALLGDDKVFEDPPTMGGGATFVVALPTTPGRYQVAAEL